MSDPSFIHLRLHTEYSLVDGLVRIKPLVRTAAELGMGALAVTDQCNLFAMVKFYEAAMAAGIKPIFGSDLWLLNEADPQRPFPLVALIQDRSGFLSLSELISRAYMEGQQRGRPLVHADWLHDHHQGLIVLSGGRESDVGRALLAGRRDLAERLAGGWRDLLGDRYYLEVQRTGREQEEDYLHGAVDLAARLELPVVATNDVRFTARDDFEAHEARVCITEGRTLDDPRRPKRYSQEQYLKSPEEMGELFQDLPEALENSVEIARRCNLELQLGNNYLPEFPVPEGMSAEAFFIDQSRKGLKERLAFLFDPQAEDFPEIAKRYQERLDFELNTIIQMKFPGYFLIVADFIQWAKDNEIPVGPGRGSGAGSLVAYSLKITDLDPLAYDLLFERFLNPERVSMPDFDVDFCMDNRDRVIDYVARKYGREKVSQIITYGSMAAKAVVRDVGRVYGHPYGFVDRIAKLIPFELGITLDKALQQEEDLRRAYEEEEEVRAIIDMARKLEGISRNAGKHAGGVVIAPSRLTDFTPLYCEEGGGNLVTQFDKNDVESVGLVKFDFLGLRTLTIIDWALKTVNRGRREQGEDPIDIMAIRMDDEATFTLLRDARTTAVFQLESRGMKELIKNLKPDCFEDIVALVALFRPGPLQSGMVDDFIARKHGARIIYPHPELEPILKPTYGIILYQEQVMQIAQVLAGYTLGGADMLRRAMGKKKPEEMAKQRDIFMSGALGRGVEEKTATYIFDLMEKFAGYGFNKSHSAAYALLSYQTAWLKCHHLSAFMAAVLSADMDNTDKVVGLIDECREQGLNVVPPDVNTSDYPFTASAPDTVVYGLGAIKGVGEAAIEGILAERRVSGGFADIFDFCRRIDLRKANRRVLESLIRAGALDRIGTNRATLMARLELATQTAEQQARLLAAGQDDLFGLEQISAPDPDTTVQGPELEEWDEAIRLQGEKETLGLYLTGHPIDRYAEELQRFTTARIGALNTEGLPEGSRAKGPTVVVAGLVVGIKTMQSQRGSRMAFLTLDDRSGRVEVAAFGKTWEEYRQYLEKDRILVIEGTLGRDEFRGGVRITIEKVYDIEQAREIYARGIVIAWSPPSGQVGAFVPALEKALEPFREGSCPVRVEFHNGRAQARIELGPGWRVHPRDSLIQRMRRLPESLSVRIDYG